MLKLLRWCENDHHCRRLDLAELQANLAEMTTCSDPIWIDLQAATEDEIKLVYEKLVPVHALTLEDVTRQRRDPRGRPHLPKVEEFNDYLFVIVNPLTSTDWPDNDEDSPLTTQLAAVMTENRLITYREGPCPAVDDLHQYLDRHSEQTRRGPDYLFHLILDATIDEYAPLLDAMADRLDELEEKVFAHDHDKQILPRLLHLKRRLTIVRKTLAYEREVLARMSRGEYRLIDEREMVYYRNVYDHVVRFTELTESNRDMVMDLLQTHQAVVSNRLNEIMKALTMVSTVVLPVSIVTGIYGMNFDYLPETKWRYGYLWAWGLMLLVGLTPLAWFRWKRWL